MGLIITPVIRDLEIINKIDRRMKDGETYNSYYEIMKICGFSVTDTHTSRRLRENFFRNGSLEKTRDGFVFHRKNWEDFILGLPEVEEFASRFRLAKKIGPI